MSEKTPKPRSFRRWARFSPGEIFLIVVALAAFIYCLRFQMNRYEGYSRGSGQYVQEVRLPATEIIRFVALGYDDLYADFLVLQAVQAFGSKWKTPNDDNTPILEYFDTVTELSPHWEEAYELGNLVLTEGRGDYELSFELLRKGIRKNPRSWRLPFLGIYNAVWGMEEPSKAREFLRHVKRVPEAPGYVIRMEEYIERQSGRYHAAFNVNLDYYLRYLHSNKKDELALTVSRFRSILDGWNKVELARAADRYYQKNGVHPPDIEALLTEEYRPDFEVPLLDKLFDAVDEYSTRGEDIREFHDLIREAAQDHVVGLPPDPNGTWYYLSPIVLSQTVSADDPGPVSLTQRYPYFVSQFDQGDRINERAIKGQNAIIRQIREDGTLPFAEDMSRFLGPDWAGGHFVYDPRGPYFYSTTGVRMTEKTDPRMGLRGTLDDFPKRAFRAAPDQTPYMRAEPTLWDFPEDAYWAEAIGLVPGVPYQDQPPQVIDGIGKRIAEVQQELFVGPPSPPAP